MPNNLINSKEVGEKYGINKASLYLLKRRGKLKAKKVKGRYFYNEENIKNYLHTRWKRNQNPLKDYYTCPFAAKQIGISLQRLYYLIRSNSVNFKLYGNTKLIHHKEIQKLKILKQQGFL